jgi:hypothetical protein
VLRRPPALLRRPQVEPSPTTGLQHLIPPLFQANAGRGGVGGGRGGAQDAIGMPLVSPVSGGVGAPGQGGQEDLEGTMGTGRRPQGVQRRRSERPISAPALEGAPAPMQWPAAVGAGFLGAQQPRDSPGRGCQGRRRSDTKFDASLRVAGAVV